MMTFQYAMGQMSVSQQLNRASEMFFQPFGRHFRIGMIIQRFVYASNGFYVLKYRANVVRWCEAGETGSCVCGEHAPW